MAKSGPNLRQIIKAVYRMTDDDERAEFERIFRARRRAYRQALADEATRAGCPQAAQRASDPSASALADLRRESRADASSIRRTWNRESAAQVDKLYAQNPRGNRNFYYRHMEDWANERGRWKDGQIAAATLGYAQNLAAREFGQVNGLADGTFRLVGPVPVGPDCTALMAAGEVGRGVRDRWDMPLHPNCWHSWVMVRPPVAVDCAEVWVG